MSDSSTRYSTPPRPSRPGPELVLRRDVDNKMVSGVAAGLAAAIDVDTAWVRLGIALSGLAFGLPVGIAYIVASVVIPAADDPSELRPAPPRMAHGLRLVFGGIGALALLDILDITDGLRAGGPTAIGFDTVVGAALLLAGGAWLLSRRDGADGWIDDAPSPHRPTPSDVSSTGAGAPQASDEPDLTPPDPLTDTFLEDLYGPLPSRPVVTEEPDRTRTGAALILLRIAGWIGVLWFAGAFLFTGGLWFLDIASVRWPPLAIGLALFALTLAPFALRKARMARPLAAVLAVAGASAFIAGGLVDVPGAIGEARYAPARASDIRPTYQLGVGEFVLDLTETDFAGSTRVETVIQVGAGSVEILYPSGAAITVSAEVGAGAVDLVDSKRGFGLDDRERLGAGGDVVLDIEVHVGVGQVIAARRGPMLASYTLASGLPLLLSCAPGEAGGTTCGLDAPMLSSEDLPPLDCWVDGPHRQALCRPEGLVDEIADPWPDDDLKDKCRVPSGGGLITCFENDIKSAESQEAPDPVTPEAPGPAEERSYLCTERADGSLDCRPAGEAAEPQAA